MSASNLFALGLLLLTANLSLCALFAPSRSSNGAADRLVQLWKLLFLAMIEVGAWAVVLHQGGAAPSLLETFSRCAACFALAGGEGGGFAPPWGEMKSFMALNGLLFIPVALIPWMAGAPAYRREQDFAEDILQIPDLQPLDDPLLPDQTASPRATPPADRQGAAGPNKSAAAPRPESAGISAVSTAEDARHARSSGLHVPVSTAAEKGVTEAPTAPQPPPLPGTSPPAAVSAAAVQLPEQKPFGFRPAIPKVQSKRECDSPEAELAEQMKPVGPTPPPIRFRWNEDPR